MGKRGGPDRGKEPPEARWQPQPGKHKISEPVSGFEPLTCRLQDGQADSPLVNPGQPQMRSRRSATR